MRHSDAIENWRYIFKASKPFPYKRVIANSESQFPVLDTMMKLNLYFKHLSPATTGSYYTVAPLWMSLIQYIPADAYSSFYRDMTKYFSIKANYTPINLKTGKSLV